MLNWSIKSFLKQVFFGTPTTDNLVEGVYADQYQDDDLQLKIRSEYRARWIKPAETPLTHPWLFDPCAPPPNWRYDPYYETWINLQ